MSANIEQFFKDLLAGIQASRLYGANHPLFEKAVEKAYQGLTQILQNRSEVTFGIIGEELAFEKDIFFELSKMNKPAILFIKSRGIERIAFYRGLAKKELQGLIELLLAPTEESGKDFQEQLSALGIKNVTAGKLKAGQSKARQSADTRQEAYDLDVFENSADNISGSIARVIDAEAVDGTVFKFAINSILENLICRHQEFLKLITLKRYDMGTYAHMLKVSILAMHFASRLGFAKDVVMEIGIAGLFHDIGKLLISRRIIRKPGRLTDEEFSQMNSHTVQGSQLLLKYTDTLGILPVVVAFEHHLKFDLKGYPKMKYNPKKQHLASSIVSICDVYDALSERRGYKADYPPDKIYSIISGDKGSTFDPWLADRFFQFMGVWPIGSIVELSDKRIGVVTDENEDDIFSPKVGIIHPEQAREIADLRASKDKIKIERYLNPYTEGKDYVSLAASFRPERN